MSSVINEAEIFSLNFCLAFVIENQDEDIMSTFSLSELLRTTQTCVNVMQRAVYQHSGRLHTPLDRIKMLTETASLQHKFLSRLCVDIENTHLATRIDRLIHFWEKAIETLRNSIISARSISNPITRTVLNHHLGIIDKMINSRPVFFRLMQENMRQALSLTFPEAVIQSKLYSSFKDNGYSYTAHISLQNISPDNPFQACKIACVELSMTLQKIVKVQNMFCSLLNTRYTDNKITKDPMEACLLFIRSSKYLRDNLKNTRNLLLQSVKQHDVEALYTRLKPFTLFRNQHRCHFSIYISSLLFTTGT